MNGQIHDAGAITASEAKGNFAVLGQWHDGDMLPRYAVHDAGAIDGIGIIESSDALIGLFR